eukprot:768556-Hanusia_phi.AAC.2
MQLFDYWETGKEDVDEEIRIFSTWAKEQGKRCATRFWLHSCVVDRFEHSLESFACFKPLKAKGGIPGMERKESFTDQYDLQLTIATIVVCGANVYSKAVPECTHILIGSHLRKTLVKKGSDCTEITWSDGQTWRCSSEIIDETILQQCIRSFLVLGDWSVSRLESHEIKSCDEAETRRNTLGKEQGEHGDRESSDDFPVIFLSHFAPAESKASKSSQQRKRSAKKNALEDDGSDGFEGGSKSTPLVEDFAESDEDLTLEQRRQRMLSKSNCDIYPSPFKVGQKVKARWKANEGQRQWYKGRIQRVQGNGKYCILYHDGDCEENVDVAFIRRSKKESRKSSAKKKLKDRDKHTVDDEATKEEDKTSKRRGCGSNGTWYTGYGGSSAHHREGIQGKGMVQLNVPAKLDGAKFKKKLAALDNLDPNHYGSAKISGQLGMITVEGVKVLCEVLVLNNVFTKIDLDGCQIGDEGILILCEMLKVNDKIRLQEELKTRMKEIEDERSEIEESDAESEDAFAVRSRQLSPPDGEQS